MPRELFEGDFSIKELSEQLDSIKKLSENYPVMIPVGFLRKLESVFALANKNLSEVSTLELAEELQDRHSNVVVAYEDDDKEKSIFIGDDLLGSLSVAQWGLRLNWGDHFSATA